MNQTLKKFDYKQNLIREYQNWTLLLRPSQYSIGSLVLVHKNEIKQYSKISLESQIEQHKIINEVESVLKSSFDYDKINYLSLMMVDPEVHMHIIPRYEKDRSFQSHVFKDFDWPIAPNLQNFNIIPQSLQEDLKTYLIEQFNALFPQKKYDIIYTTGAFDLFHYGHLNILRKSKELCNKLIVGVSDDQLIIKAKNRQPTIPYIQRAAIVDAINYVDLVIPQMNKNKQEVVDKYNIDAITVGDDWKGKYPQISCDLIYLKYTAEISSTLLRQTL